MAVQNRSDDAKTPEAKGDPIHRVDDRGGLSSTGATPTTDAHQPSALGGEVAARSGSTDIGTDGKDTDGAGTRGINQDKSAGSGSGFGGSSGA